MDEVNKLGKILIVDDNEDVLFALNLLLEPYTEKIKVATTPDRIEHFMTTFYKRQNKLFHFHKTFCSEFDIINTKQNVHFTKVVSPIYQFCLSLHQFSIGAKAPFINKRD